MFVMLTYSSDIHAGMSIKVGNESHANFRDQVAFVAIKNGEHNGIGYLIDTGADYSESEPIKLSSLPSRIADAFGLTWPLVSNT